MDGCHMTGNVRSFIFYIVTFQMIMQTQEEFEDTKGAKVVKMKV